MQVKTAGKTSENPWLMPWCCFVLIIVSFSVSSGLIIFVRCRLTRVCMCYTLCILYIPVCILPSLQYTAFFVFNLNGWWTLAITIWFLPSPSMTPKQLRSSCSWRGMLQELLANNQCWSIYSLSGRFKIVIWTSFYLVEFRSNMIINSHCFITWNILEC